MMAQLKNINSAHVNLIEFMYILGWRCILGFFIPSFYHLLVPTT